MRERREHPEVYNIVHTIVGNSFVWSDDGAIPLEVGGVPNTIMTKK